MAFFLVPLLEVWIFVKVGRETGAAWVIAMIFLTAVVGVYFLRQQGLSTLQRAQSSMANGMMPARELLEGAMLLIAGAFLLTPGFFTDALGFLLLWPRVRNGLALKMSGWVVERTVVSESIDISRESYKKRASHGESRAGSDASPKPGQHEVIEGEFERDGHS